MNFLLIIILVFSREALGMGGAKEENKLLESLFVDYNKDVRPSHDFSRPININVVLDIMCVLSLDIKNQVLNLIGFLHFEWKDELLVWSPEEHGGIKDIILPSEKIWKPDFVFSNSIEDFPYSFDGYHSRVKSDGLVLWQPGFRLCSICKVDMSKYPFDETTCPIRVMPWTYDNSSVNFHYDNLVSLVSFDFLIPNGEFELFPGDNSLQLLESNGLFYEFIEFRLTLKRRPAYIAVSLLMPITMLALLSTVSFLLSPEEPEKVTVSMTVMLSFTVFLGVIDNDIPETSENMPYLVVYVSLLQALAFLGVAGNSLVLIVNRIDKKREEQPLNSEALVTQVVSIKTPAQTKEKKQYDFAPQTNLSPFQQPKTRVLKEQREKWTRAYALNRSFLIISSTALVVITCVIWTLVLL